MHSGIGGMVVGFVLVVVAHRKQSIMIKEFKKSSEPKWIN
jgi:hypothetical protein